MPPYNNDVLSMIQGLLGNLEQNRNRNLEQQPAQPEQQEQAGGKEMVDRAIEQSIPRQAPNPYQIGNLRNILEAKTAWQDADALAQNPSAYAKANGLTDDTVQALAAVQKQNAQSAADQSRYKLNAAGLGTNGYSANDDTLEDVQRNLASREAQDLTEAMQGAYSMNSDQYYEKKYEEAIMRGLSHRRAKRLAGSQAREYQANRVAYLDGLYNSYGREGRVTNDIGNQILGMVAMENPMLANFYSAVYPNQRDAYTRDNQIEDKLLDKTNALDLINANFANEKTRMGLANLYNTQQQKVGGEIYKENRAFDSALDMKKTLFANNLALQNEIEKMTFASAKEEKAFLNRAKQGAQLAQFLGFAPNTPEYQATVASSVGITLPKAMSADKDKVVKTMLDLSEGLQKDINTLNEQLADATLSDERKSQIKDDLERLEQGKRMLQMQMLQMNGLTNQIPDYTGNPEKDLPIIKSMFAETPTASREDKIKNIVDWVRETQPDISEAVVEKYLVDSGLLPPIEEKKNSTTTNARNPKYEKTANDAYNHAQQINSANYGYNPAWRSGY